MKGVDVDASCEGKERRKKTSHLKVYYLLSRTKVGEDTNEKKRVAKRMHE